MNMQQYEEMILAKLMNADKALSTLPHPARIKAITELAGADDADSKMRTVAVWSGLCKSAEMGLMAAELLSDPTITIPEFLSTMTQLSLPIRQLTLQMSHHNANTNFGNIEGMVMESRLRLLEWPVFQTRNTLEERLMLTDIGEQMPCRFFRLPYDRLYLECGEARTSPIRIHNEQSGEHIFEGAYLEQFVHDIGGKPVRTIYMMLIGSPVGKKHCGDDAYYTLSVPLDNDDQSLEEVLDKVFSRTESSVRENTAHLPTGHFSNFGQKDRDAIRAAVYHVAKVMLYLNSQDARTATNKERSDLVKQIASLKGGGKIGKAKRKLTKAYDRIIVGAPNQSVVGRDSLSSQPSPAGHRSAHWRRGHFRNQAHGPNWSNHRIVYIEPLLVHNDLESIETVARKTYKVGDRA